MTYLDLEKKKQYHKEYIRKHYLENKDYYKQKAKVNDKKRQQEIKTFITTYKIEHGCSGCGINNPVVLDFHHLRDKIKAVAVMARYYSLNRIKEEIEKCILLCANCHRIHHHNERNS